MVFTEDKFKEIIDELQFAILELTESFVRHQIETKETIEGIRHAIFMVEGLQKEQR